MKKIIATVLYIISTVLAAQTHPVEWQFYSKDLPNNEYVLYFKAKIDKGWYIYSQQITETPPIPTTVHFDKNSTYSLIGKVEEKGKLIDEYDEMLEKNIKKYGDQVTFIATVRSNSGEPVLVNGVVEYMSCDHEKCLPPTKKKFQFKLLPTASTSTFALSKRELGSDKPVAAKSYSTGTYIMPESTLNIPASGPIHLAPYNTQDVSDKELNAMKALPVQNISNDDRTTDLESSEYMVAANVMKYFPKGKKEQEKQLLAQKMAARQLADERKRAEEAKAEEKRQKETVVTEPPVDWSFSMLSQGEGIYELTANVKIADGWYLYSQNNSGDAPAPTTITFEPVKGVEFLDAAVGEVGNLRTELDTLFGKQVNRYSNEVTFKRRVKFIENHPVHGSVKFMTTNDHQYLMPTTVSFVYNENAEAVLPVKKTAAGWWWAMGAAALALMSLSYALTFWGNSKK